jgi:hypothetical protein
MSAMSDALLPRGAVAGGVSQLSVEAPGRSGGVIAGLAGYSKLHVDELVVVGGVAVGEL